MCAPGTFCSCQAMRAFEKLETCPECAGASLEDMVKGITWSGAADERATLNGLSGARFQHDAPARSAPIVDLPLSIEATAIARRWIGSLSAVTNDRCWPTARNCARRANQAQNSVVAQPMACAAAAAAHGIFHLAIR